MLRIKDLLFDTKDATLEALLNNGKLLWNVNIETFEREIDGEVWQPRASVDFYPAMGRSVHEFTQHDWHIANARAYSGDFIAPWQPNCCRYVFEHDSLENSRLKFSSSPISLSLSWSGRCSVHWGKEYDQIWIFSPRPRLSSLVFMSLWKQRAKHGNSWSRCST